eukprot:SAG31_NODE_2436_length_5700_cov_13.780396_4_plen_99_part_00
MQSLQVFPPLAAQAVFLAPVNDDEAVTPGPTLLIPRHDCCAFCVQMDAMKTIKENGDVGDMPLLPYAAMAVNGVGWVAYGLLQGQPTIWVHLEPSQNF